VSTEAPTKTGLRAKLRERWETLKNEHASPLEIGIGVAVGSIIACSPLWGLQTLLVFVVAWVFRLNRIAVLLGSTVSFPLVAPFLLFAAAQLGEFLRHGQWLPVTVEGLRGLHFRDLGPSLAADLFLGGAIEGAVIGGILGAFAGLVVRQHRRHQPAT
jgi:uncharacterized protein (DUF2062 family)